MRAISKIALVASVSAIALLAVTIFRSEPEIVRSEIQQVTSAVTSIPQYQSHYDSTQTVELTSPRNSVSPAATTPQVTGSDVTPAGEFAPPETAAPNLEGLLPDSVRLAALGLTRAEVESFVLQTEWVQREISTLSASSETGEIDMQYKQNRLETLHNRADRIRETLGDSGYDARLYAAAIANRVVIGSDADDAVFANGLSPGDRIATYDGQPIFDRAQLEFLEANGSADEPVNLTIERDSSSHELSVPRGSLLGTGTTTATAFRAH